jgi:hypothetical protein
MKKDIINKELSNEAEKPAFMVGAVSGSLIFQNGYKGADFVVYNPLNIELKDEPLVMNEIQLKDNEFWKNLKSLTWSSNCRFFFVINENHLIVGSTLNNDAFLCINLSWRIFEEYLNAFRKRS